MDSGTIIIGVIFVVICTAFFIGLSMSQKSRQRKILTDALQFVGVKPEEFGEYSMTGNVILGWLASGQEFFFYRKSAKAEKSSRISLGDIREIKLEKAMKSRSTPSGNYTYVDAINLRLSHTKQGQADVYLPLFNQDEDAQVGSELQVGQDWVNKVNSRLAS